VSARPCAVCGEDVAGEPHLSLAVFTVCDGVANDGMFFAPEHEPEEFETWNDLPFLRPVHLRCSVNYFEGVIADLQHRRKQDA